MKQTENSMGSIVQWLEVWPNFWLSGILAVWPWATYLLSQWLSFFIYEMGMIIVPASLG